MTTLPIELANARTARTEAWNEYNLVVEREHTRGEFDTALTKANEAEITARNWYERWQAVGGTSDIESIVEAEKFLNFVEVALTHPETIATADPRTAAQIVLDVARESIKIADDISKRWSETSESYKNSQPYNNNLYPF